VLWQLSEKLDLPTGPFLIEELVALARAQRRTLCAAHRQLQGHPLLAHLLKSRIAYRQKDEHRTNSLPRARNSMGTSMTGASCWRSSRGDSQAVRI